MPDAETEDGISNLPVALEPAGEKVLARTRTEASFLSQRIASKHNMMAQRGKRRAPVSTAVDAYATGSTVAVVRMPQGYRRTVIA
jgi:hypothetical protein